MKYSDIQWEDEDDVSQQKKKTGDEEFEELLKETPFDITSFRPGAAVEGTIMSISETSNDVIVELSQRHTGVIDKNQLFDESGEQKYRAGDRIRAYVISQKGGEIQLSTSLSATQKSRDDLYGALHHKVPVKGKVVGENPGGFDVIILGQRGFCPVSQMDLRFVQNKAEYIGRDFEFLIEKIESGGRNVVVSRRALLQQNAALKLEELEKQLNQDVILSGTVTEVRDYGAFVDLGGVEGFVHVSEMSYSRINKAYEFVKRGEQVRVKVLAITDKDGKKQISLSMKAVADDPWINAASDFRLGETYAGRIMRLEKFGAFVELTPGIEGLIHVSEMSWGKRVNHPSEVLNPGQDVNVRILSLDSGQKKIALSLKDLATNPWQQVETKFAPGTLVKGKVDKLKGFGAIVALSEEVAGLLPLETMKKAYGESFRKKCSPPKEIEVKIAAVYPAEQKILLTLPELAAEDDDLKSFQEYMKEQQARTSPGSHAASSDKKVGTFGALLAEKLKKG